ncbi:MAG: VRR-NUC domain-containing protein [Thiogranum sp.]|nr:VRR-NUC domain-containing protein [Thiogranum sp.]
MSLIRIDTLEEAPDFIQKCYARVTQGLIYAPVRIVSRKILLEPSTPTAFKTLPWDRFEREARFHYENDGFEVIRLEHFASQMVGDEREKVFADPQLLGTHLRRVLSPADYQTYISKSAAIQTAIALNGIDPKLYSVSFYPPDFLVINRNDRSFKFVEVKGPTDKLRFRQANWYVNLIPTHWDYEIFASVNRQFDDVFLCTPTGPRAGEHFAASYQQAMHEVAEFRTMEQRRRNV